jgi:hypothetical protein
MIFLAVLANQRIQLIFCSYEYPPDTLDKSSNILLGNSHTFRFSVASYEHMGKTKPEAKTT